MSRHKSRHKRHKPRLTKEFKLSSFASVVAQATDYIPKDIADDILGALRSGNLSHLKEVVSRYDQPQEHADPKQYLAVSQLIALIKKFPFEGSESDAEIASMKKFMEAEARCRGTNEKFRRRDFGPDLFQILTDASITFNNILGDFRRQYHSILEEAKHGPGSTLCLRGSEVTDYWKWSEFPWSANVATTQFFKDLLAQDEQLLRELIYQFSGVYIGEITDPVGLAGEFVEAYSLELFELRDSNRVTFVPKTAWIKRTIAVEARLSIFFQLGAGRVITRNLLKFGVNTRDQTINQKLAWIGSISGAYATLDLVSASDCIAIELVKWLCGNNYEWYDFLDALRSPFYELEGNLKEYQKWSSMGNGYTFPLETAIFYSISRAAADFYGFEDEIISCYGDDIICPTFLAERLSDVLQQVGFDVNQGKSHWSGPFRESCGADYWYGVSVRPFYLKSMPKEQGDIYYLLNSFYPFSDLFDLDRIHHHLLAYLRHEDRLYGPITEDRRGHIWAPPSYLYEEGFLRYDKRLHRTYFRTYVAKPTKFRELLLKEGLADDAWCHYIWHRGASRESESVHEIFRPADPAGLDLLEFRSFEIVKRKVVKTCMARVPYTPSGDREKALFPTYMYVK